MRQLVCSVLFAGVLFAFLGCGTDDFQAGNRLLIETITDLDGSVALQFHAVEETDDSGADGLPATFDDGENDGRPTPGEAILTPLGPDKGVIRVSNEPRLGVDPGVPLRVFRVDVTYLDGAGLSQSFAPTLQHSVSVLVDDGQTEEFEVILVPLEMKTGGLRDLFLFGSDAEKRAAARWTATLDVYARDDRNKDTVHAQGAITLHFINPMVAQQP